MWSGVALDEIVGEEIEDLAPVHEFAAAMPVHVAEDALGQELPAPGARQRAQMNVGEVGEREHEWA